MDKEEKSRRGFIKGNTLGALGLFLSPGVSDFCSDGYELKSPALVNNRDIPVGRRALIDLREMYRAELFDHFLPNMDRLVIDHEFGGFICDIDTEQKKRISTNKLAWFEGRGIWVYSFLYNHFGKDPKFLDIARKSKDFILKHTPVDHNFWISSFSREGSPLSKSGDIFGDLYISEGLAEYAKASQEDEYFILARKIFLNCFSRYDSVDYQYTGEKISGPRVLNHWMILLWNATQILEYKPDPEIDLLADRCVDAIMNYHFNPDYDLLNVTLSHDLKPIADSRHTQMVSFGLGIQALWMVMFEALRKRDMQLFDRAQTLFKRHVDVSCDHVYGGYFWALDHVDNYTFQLRKALSVHDEVLIGAMCLLEHMPDAWAEKCVFETYKYMKQNFVHPNYAFAVESGDRKMIETNKKGMGIYHHPRQLMLNLLAIDRMIKRRSRTGA